MKITPRLAITLTFIAFGMIMGTQTGSIPALKTQTGMDEFLFGILATIFGAANIAGLSMGGVLNHRFSHRSVLLFVIPLNYLLLVFSLLTQSIWVCGFAWVLLWFCTGVMDVFMNAEASVVEHDLGKPVFSSFHSAVLYAIGAAGFLSGYVAAHYGLIFCAIAPIPFALVALYAVAKAIPKTVHHEETLARESKAGLPVKILVLIGIVIGLDVAAELTCVQWSGQMLNAMRPDLAAYSGLGVGFYGLCSGTARAVGDWFRARFGDIPIVVVSFLIGLAGFLVLATQPSFTVSIIAFAITGSGLGLIFPCLFSLSARLAPHARAAALGMVSMVSGGPRIVFPFLLGWIAQQHGLGSIYVVVAAVTAIAIAFTWWVAHAMTHTKEAQVALRPNG